MKRSARLAVIALATMSILASAQAQFFPGQGGVGGQRSSSRSSSSRQYPNNSTVGDAVISIDPDTRNIIVIADDETAAQVQNVVQNLDRPKPQVLIKVVFLEVQHNNSSDIGIEGGWIKNMGNSTTGSVLNAFGMSGLGQSVSSNSISGVNSLGIPIAGLGQTPPGAGLYQIFTDEYQVTLRAIAQAGKVRVLSRPSIVARNSQPATITVGQNVPLITNVRFDNFGNAINSVSYTSIGIILTVTPFITAEGTVEMIVSPETSELVADRSQWVPISTGAGSSAAAPLINTRSADTVVVTPDGQTVIIGGLMYDSKAEGSSKIPLLGDIPVLGNLFKRQTKSKSQTELLIFLTPHVIRSPEDMANVSDVEQEKSGATKVLTDKELQKFLDQLPTSEEKFSPLPAPPENKKQVR